MRTEIVLAQLTLSQVLDELLHPPLLRQQYTTDIPI